MKTNYIKNVGILCLSLFIFYSCHNDEISALDPENDRITTPEDIDTDGLYILNEGNMGYNKASIDYFDYTKGTYSKNIYGKANPSVVGNLGDVGNDIQIYGSKLYAVINVSNYVEVMNAKNATHIAEIKIPNCRYIIFDKGYAYISSYAGPVGMDPNAQLGYIAKVDTATFEIISKETVGYQPEEMTIANNKLYVANSGGYRAPDYDHTVSVIDLSTFKEIKKIEVDINLWKIKKDKNNKLWVTSRGNYNDIPSKTFIIDPETDNVEKKLDIPISDMAFIDDKIYFFSYQWSTKDKIKTYGIIDINTQKIISDQFIKNNVESQITVPYGITINSDNGDIFITDAKNYVSPGTIYCFDKFGYLKWKAVTGDIPGHFAFLPKNLKK
ncbi:YncE family protein [Apibacter raozihei]|uniref:YncE family protein n=1 Tax=Apibacter raozihei TaxID=2500547 RepID=UPI001E3C5F57|nr:DUF5074 domain-containing protein [Apibacter raozihei]